MIIYPSLQFHKLGILQTEFRSIVLTSAMTRNRSSVIGIVFRKLTRSIFIRTSYKLQKTICRMKQKRQQHHQQEMIITIDNNTSSSLSKNNDVKSILHRLGHDDMVSSCNSCDNVSLSSTPTHSSIISGCSSSSCSSSCSSSSCSSCSSCSCAFTDPTGNHNKILKRPVSFDAVTIRTYNLTLGDHPSCTKGPALSLSWEYEQYKKIPIDIFEEFREGKRGQSKHEMYISSQIRKDFVKRLYNVTEEEVLKRQNEMDEIKKQRLKTRAQMKKKDRRRKKLKKLFKIFLIAISLIT